VVADFLIQSIIIKIVIAYGSAQESIMRIDSANIANELMKSIKVT
jgi:hypothetical protein